MVQPSCFVHRMNTSSRVSIRAMQQGAANPPRPEIAAFENLAQLPSSRHARHSKAQDCVYIKKEATVRAASRRSTCTLRLNNPAHRHGYQPAHYHCPPFHRRRFSDFPSFLFTFRIRGSAVNPTFAPPDFRPPLRPRACQSVPFSLEGKACMTSCGQLETMLQCKSERVFVFCWR